MSTKGLIQQLGIEHKQEGSQLVIACHHCGDAKHCYVDEASGLYHCKKCDERGNAYQLAKHYMPGKTPVDIMKLIEEHGFKSDAKPEPAKPKDISWLKQKLKPAEPADIARLCKAKGVTAGALARFRPYVHVTEPVMYLPAMTPLQGKACGFLRCHLDGELITASGKQQKYPAIGNHGIYLHDTTSESLLFCEAWRDALAAISAGLNATASTGGASTFKPEWVAYFKEKHVDIIMDADTAGARQAQRVAKAIYEVAKSVKIVKLPYEVLESHGKDLFDYMQDHTKEDLCWMIDNSDYYNPQPAKKETPNIIELEDDLPGTVAEAFEADSDVIYHFNSIDGWSIYTNDQYQQVTDSNEIRLYIRRFLEKCIVKKSKKVPEKDGGGFEDYTEKLKKQSSGFVSDIMEALAARHKIHLTPGQKSPCCLVGELNMDRVICLDNGVLDWSNNPYRLIPNTPDYYTFNYLPYEWNGKKESDIWNQFLLDATNDDDELKELLQMWAGYCLMSNYQGEQKFMLCYGEAATGKSVFCDVLTHLVGQKNISTVPLERFDDPHHVTQTYGKMLNITDESGSHLEEAIESNLKHYTGGTLYTFKRMYKEPFSAYPTAKIMVVTNNPPHFKDVSDGIWRRLLLIPFDNVVPEEHRIKDLASKIIATELPGVLAWALAGARQLEKYNGFKTPAKCKELLANYKEMAQPEMRFLEENFEAVEGPEEDRDSFSIECRLFWVRYKSWCSEENISPKGNKKVLAAVKKFVPFFERKRDKNGIPRKYRYKGLIAREVENVNVGGSNGLPY